MRVTAHEVIRFVAAETGLTVEALTGPCRERKFAYPRFMSVWLVRRLCPHVTYSTLGRMLSGRDHTTLLHAKRQAERMLQDGHPLSLMVRKALVHFGAPDDLAAIDQLINDLTVTLRVLEATREARLNAGTASLFGRAA